MKKALLLPICFLFGGSLRASDKVDQDAAIKQLQQAVSKTNIFALASFQLKAQVQIDNAGKPTEGSLQFSWNGPEQWKEEIHFPEYNEIQVGGKDAIWIQRSTNFIPYRIHQHHATMGFGSGSLDSTYGKFGSLVQLGLVNSDHIKKEHSRKSRGEKLSCIEVEDQRQAMSEICISEGEGTLIRDSPFEDQEFTPVADKIYPRSLNYTENGKVVVRVKIQEISTPVKFASDTFRPLSEGSKIVGCINPTPGPLVKKVPPQYPPTARDRRIQGTVIMDVWIGKDGTPRINKVEMTPSPDLEKASVDAVSQWRYDPATCNGNPVEIETILRVNYALQF